MISIAEWLNPTRIVGLTAYLFAFVSCVIGWRGGRGAPDRRRLAAFLAVVDAMLLVDLAFNGRWLLHDWLENEAIAHGEYLQRFGPQVAALGFSSFGLAAGIRLAIVRFKGRPGAFLAVCGGIVSFWCWCIEVISEHKVDAVMYYQIKGVMLVSLIWIAASLMTGVGILWDMRAAKAESGLRGIRL